MCYFLCWCVVCYATCIHILEARQCSVAALRASRAGRLDRLGKPDRPGWLDFAGRCMVVQWFSNAFTPFSNALHGVAMVLHCFARVCMDCMVLHVFTRIYMDLHGFARFDMVLQGLAWIYMELHGFTWFYMV